MTTPRKKSVKKAGEKAGAMVTQPHGGRIWKGAPANPVAGTGRPRDEVRAALRELAKNDVVPFLRRTMKGKGEAPEKLSASAMILRFTQSNKELVITSANAAPFFDCVHAAIVELHGEQAANAVKERAMELMEQQG